MGNYVFHSYNIYIKENLKLMEAQQQQQNKTSPDLMEKEAKIIILITTNDETLTYIYEKPGNFADEITLVC